MVVTASPASIATETVSSPAMTWRHQAVALVVEVALVAVAPEGAGAAARGA